MAGERLFIDTGGFYALIAPASPAHSRAVEIITQLAKGRRRAVTTDYVIDETATLLRMRGLGKLLTELFRLTEESRALQVEWVSPDRFVAARKMMMKHLDQEFSFTDCTSFVVMRELRWTDALATDRHFRSAGFNPLLTD